MSLFIGRLGRDVRTADLEDVFRRYGRMTRCEVRGNGMGSSLVVWLLSFHSCQSLFFPQSRSAAVWPRP